MLARADGHLGDMIEQANRQHHVRRLDRIGWDRAFRDSTGWGSGTFPTREGNHVAVHIDGEAALPAIVSAIRGARSFVHVAGWTVDPDFAMERGAETITLRALLAEAAQPRRRARACLGRRASPRHAPDACRGEATDASVDARNTHSRRP